MPLQSLKTVMVANEMIVTMVIVLVKMVIPAKHVMLIVFSTSLHPNPITFSLILMCFAQPTI